jgi:hypothetical protein
MDNSCQHERIEVLKVGADKRPYRLTISHYAHQTGLPGRTVDAYSYLISKPDEDGYFKVLVDNNWCGALKASDMGEAKKEAFSIFARFLASPEPL